MRKLGSGFSSPLFVFLVAFIVRLAAIPVIHPSLFHDTSPLWKSGLEIVNIASSIAGHKGFSSPFGIETGPTAWIPPVYPTIVALIFLAFGPHSSMSALMILAIQALFSALVCLPLYVISTRIVDHTCAVWTAWLWALYPYAVLIPCLFVWETSLSAFLLTMVGCLSLGLSRNSFRHGALTGVVWGIVALTNTALLSVMPVFLVVPYLKRPLHFPGKAVMAAVLMSIMVVCPWIAWTWHALGVIVPIRSNFGEELWLGNHQDGTGRIVFGISPSDNTIERERYRERGEITYIADRRRSAIDFILDNPGRFLSLALYRLRYWWFAEGETAPVFSLYRLLTLMSLLGVVLALRRNNNAGLRTIVIAIAVYPVVYYVTDVYVRYRYPIEPFLTIFAGFLASRTFAFARAKITLGPNASLRIPQKSKLVVNAAL